MVFKTYKTYFFKYILIQKNLLDKHAFNTIFLDINLKPLVEIFQTFPELNDMIMFYNNFFYIVLLFIKYMFTF